MFSLHETTRIRLCRAGFFALCVAPICAVLCWSVVVRLDWYRSAHEQAIGRHLGWHAQLAEASTPRPNLLLYRGLELTDPDNMQLLARLPFVEIDTSDEVIVRLPFPGIVNGTRIDAFWDALLGVARATTDSRHVRFEASNLTVHLDDGDQSFTNLVGDFDGDESQALAKLSFSLAVAGDGPQSEPCELMLMRRQHAGTRVHSIEFSTGGSRLPASLITAVWPSVERLGKACLFTGRISAVEQSGAWRTELHGNLSHIDLDSLVGSFPHKLSGIASARLDHVKIAGGRLANATGSVTAGPGVISRSLVQSAEKHLHVRAADMAFAGPGNLLDYEELCANFEVGAHGITLRGAVPDTEGGLLADSRYVLVEEAPVVSQPVVDLVRTLVPSSEYHVPATQETVSLTAWLPVPSINPEPGQEKPLTARPVNVIPKYEKPANFRH